VVVEVMVEVVEVVTSREDSQASKIGVAEDVVKEVVGRTTPTSNVTSVGSMVITRRIATPTNVITVIKWDILQRIVKSKRR
jgi:aromatic ring hydroxylase